MGCLQKKKKNNLSFAGCNGQMTACTSKYHFCGKPCSPNRSIQTHERDAHEQKESFGFQNRAHAFTTNGFSEHGGHTSRNCSEPDTLPERTSTQKLMHGRWAHLQKTGFAALQDAHQAPKVKKGQSPPTTTFNLNFRRQLTHMRKSADKRAKAPIHTVS